MYKPLIFAGSMAGPPAKVDDHAEPPHYRWPAYHHRAPVHAWLEPVYPRGEARGQRHLHVPDQHQSRQNQARSTLCTRWNTVLWRIQNKYNHTKNKIRTILFDNRRSCKFVKFKMPVSLKPQSDIHCNRSATSPRLTIFTDRRGRNKVPDRSRRGCREVGDWSGTSLRPNQSQPGFCACTKTWLRLIWSQTGPGEVADQSPISRRPVADESPTNCKT